LHEVARREGSTERFITVGTVPSTTSSRYWPSLHWQRLASCSAAGSLGGGAQVGDLLGRKRCRLRDRLRPLQRGIWTGRRFGGGTASIVERSLPDLRPVVEVHGLDRRVPSVGPLTWRARAVIGEAPSDRDSMSDLRRIRETRPPHERRNALSEVVSQALASVVEASYETVEAHLRTSEVKQVQGAAGFEYPPCLTQRLRFFFRPEVVEHQGG
jgi:hypothetical protein